VGSSGSRAAPQAGRVVAVELGTVVVVVVEPLPLAGAAPPEGALAEPPPDPQAAARMPTSATPARRAASRVIRFEREIIG
jgi:hypothetical protein